MTTVDDPFERAVEREERYRRRWRRRREEGGLTGVLIVLAMILVPLPLHLWLAGWDTRAPSVVAHLIGLTGWLTIVAIVWLSERGEREQT